MYNFIKMQTDVKQVSKHYIRVNMSVFDSTYVLEGWLELFYLSREICHNTGNNHLVFDRLV